MYTRNKLGGIRAILPLFNENVVTILVFLTLFQILGKKTIHLYIYFFNLIFFLFVSQTFNLFYKHLV